MMRQKRLKLGLLSLTLLVELGGCKSSQTDPSVATKMQPTSSPPTAESGDSMKTEGWQYATTRDDFSDAIAKGATIKSVNQVYFDPPYEGGSRLGVAVVSYESKIGVMLTIERGQFLCNPDGCNVSFRFDEGPVKAFKAHERNGSTEHLFITNNALPKLIASAHIVTARATFFEYGNRTFDFLTKEPLDLNRLK